VGLIADIRRAWSHVFRHGLLARFAWWVARLISSGVGCNDIRSACPKVDGTGVVKNLGMCGFNRTKISRHLLLLHKYARNPGLLVPLRNDVRNSHLPFPAPASSVRCTRRDSLDICGVSQS